MQSGIIRLALEGAVAHASPRPRSCARLRGTGRSPPVAAAGATNALHELRDMSAALRVGSITAADRSIAQAPVRIVAKMASLSVVWAFRRATSFSFYKNAV